jgi:hypothetical protein
MNQAEAVASIRVIIQLYYQLPKPVQERIEQYASGHHVPVSLELARMDVEYRWNQLKNS